MTEENILERVRKRAAIPLNSRLIVGIGDDCAVYRPQGSNEDLLITTDMLLEGAHFKRGTHAAEEVGHKVLARGLSDIAAMGGRPMVCLLSLAVPRWATPGWIDRCFGGLRKLSRRTGTALAGGDLARSDTFASDIVVIGSVPKGAALLRSGARVGDGVYISGRLGGSALGLRTRRGRAWRRHLRPEARLELGEFLRRRLHATAAMDLSDGLSLDLRRLCLASKVSAEIDAPPVYPGASLEDALHGGEDYELLFTAAPGSRVPAKFGKLPLTRIGVIRRGQPGRVLLGGRALAPLGYDHFKRS